MQIVFAYCAVVLIWSTTPLAIKWSNHSLSYLASIGLRMALAALLLSALLLLFKRKLLASPAAFKASAAAALGIFPGMLLVYWSAQYINSGTLALLFAIQPLVTGLLSWWLLKHNPFDRRKLTALALAFAGLCLIFMEQLSFGPQALWGALGIIAATVVVGYSSVLLKLYPSEQDSFSQTAGALILSLPGLALCWWLGDGDASVLWLAEQWSLRSLLGLSYLIVMGSMLGFALYYFLLRELQPLPVSVISMLTPPLALWLGQLVEGEASGPMLLWGGAVLLCALALYQGIWAWLFTRLLLLRR